MDMGSIYIVAHFGFWYEGNWWLDLVRLDEVFYRNRTFPAVCFN